MRSNLPVTFHTLTDQQKTENVRHGKSEVHGIVPRVKAPGEFGVIKCTGLVKEQTIIISPPDQKQTTSNTPGGKDP